jgi:acetoacetate decarboxylase
MREHDVRERAFAMPLTSPAYPPGPYRFINREYLIITYRTDPEKLRALVPEPLLPDGDTVKYEFIRMPDSTGFGDYTETGQVIPVTFHGRKGSYSHCMFLNGAGKRPDRYGGITARRPPRCRIRAHRECLRLSGR